MITKFRKIFACMRDAWLILGITFALFVFIEIVLSIAFHYLDAQINSQLATADTYRNAEWPKEYYEEFKKADGHQWSSYVYWRRKPYEGQYINIDSQGIRKTWRSNMGRDNKGIRSTIFFFGGSTMWGTGARDDFTIPSIVAKQLSANGINAEVINFGQAGYVSTQEVLALIRELHKGNIPDLVIFYDGVNDVFSAYQQQRAGLPQNEFNRVIEFKSSQSISAADAWSFVLNNLSTKRFMRGALRRMSNGSLLEDMATHNLKNSPNHSITDEEALANDVLNIYEKNIEIVESLAERFRFKTLFYWQPTVFSKKLLTEYEDGERQRNINLQPFFDMVYKLASRHDFTKNDKIEFHNLSMLLSDEPEPFFVDWCHLGETGNKYIAERIVVDALSKVSGGGSAEQGAESDRFSASLQNGNKR